MIEALVIRRFCPAKGIIGMFRGIIAKGHADNSPSVLQAMTTKTRGFSLKNELLAFLAWGVACVRTSPQARRRDKDTW